MEGKNRKGTSRNIINERIIINEEYNEGGNNLLATLITFVLEKKIKSKRKIFLMTLHI